MTQQRGLTLIELLVAVAIFLFAGFMIVELLIKISPYMGGKILPYGGLVLLTIASIELFRRGLVSYNERTRRLKRNQVKEGIAELKSGMHPLQYGVILLVPILFALSSGWLVEKTLTNAVEYWGGHVEKVVYETAWTEESTSTDSKGNTSTSYIDHPDSWYLRGSNGEFVGISSSTYAELTRRWGNRPDVEHNVHFNAELGYNGDRYTVEWDGQDNTLEPCFSRHVYENKPAATFGFKEVDPKRYDLFEYPNLEDGYRCNTLLGYSGAGYAQAADLLEFANAKLGPTKQVRILVLVYKDKPKEAALEQEQYWKGGNKNELIVCVGLEGNVNDPFFQTQEYELLRAVFSTTRS